MEAEFDDAHKAHIVEFQVVTGHRQLGFGQALLSGGLEQIFQRASTVEMMVPCRNLSQPWLRKFLEGHGFQFEVVAEDFDCLKGTLHKSNWPASNNGMS